MTIGQVAQKRKRRFVEASKKRHAGTRIQPKTLTKQVKNIIMTIRILCRYNYVQPTALPAPAMLKAKERMPALSAGLCGKQCVTAESLRRPNPQIRRNYAHTVQWTGKACCAERRRSVRPDSDAVPVLLPGPESVQREADKFFILREGKKECNSRRTERFSRLLLQQR